MENISHTTIHLMSQIENENEAKVDKACDTSDNIKVYKSGVFPLRPYSHILSLIICLLSPIVCVFCAAYILYVINT